MIDHFNPYLASTLIAERLHEVRAPHSRHAAVVRARRTTRRRARRASVNG